MRKGKKPFNFRSKTELSILVRIKERLCAEAVPEKAKTVFSVIIKGYGKYTVYPGYKIRSTGEKTGKEHISVTERVRGKGGWKKSIGSIFQECID